MNAETEIQKEKGASSEEAERLKLPLFSKIFFVIFGVAAALLGVCFISEDFADFFCRYIAAGPRALLGWLTAWIPFSLAELFVLSVVPIAVLAIIYCSRKASGSWHNTGIVCLSLLSILTLFFSAYVFSLGAGYRGSGLDEKLGIEKHDVSAEQLKKTAQILADDVAKEADGILFGADGFSIMPYNVSGMTDRLLDAYDKACEKYSFIQRLHTPLKSVVHSEPWTYTHITGVYSYFTGEANLNINMPDYTLPFTGAHELAHQRGTAREDEANFVAYLVCKDADDQYLRYSAALNMYEYVASALASADIEAYSEVYRSLPKNVRTEMAAYNTFFSKYRRSVVATVSEAVNDTYLKINGTPGTKSYGMVVDLCVAYYENAE